uniref:Large ribosomal subunit protein eL22 n=1 Tax=Tanacetum cinerariifolium TaxID=118510 RepID=A0A6L2MQC3_TANCI|nr:60S ribosomal protein L22-2-like [Tanacetum cinerariifolium]
MIVLVMHIVKNDMVIHTEKTGMMRLVIEIDYDSKIDDVFDKVTWSFDGLQPEQVDRIVVIRSSKDESSSRSKGGKKKTSTFVIDCGKPVKDKIMENASLEKFLQERIKVGGKAGNLGISKFSQQLGIISGERLRFYPFGQIVNGNENIFVSSRRRKWSHEIDAPYVENLANLNCILRHFITLRNFTLTLTSVTPCDQVMGIPVNSGPKETGIKYFLSGEIGTMMAPSGSFMTSFDDIISFLAMHHRRMI